MHLAEDLVRGKEVALALDILSFSKTDASRTLAQLWLCAINTYVQKNEDANLEEAGLFVKTITVDGGMMLKRLRPAPQGRAHRIRKRSNHVTIVLGQVDNTQSN